jgi:hypothetical protein
MTDERKADVGPPPGFGKGVNDYLNDYVKAADAKATAFLVANLSVAALVLRLKPVMVLPWAVRWVALGALAVSVFYCAWVVFPRLPKGRMGVVFWEDIRFFKSPELYEHELLNMDDAAIEAEYAAQNWFVSGVLHDKFTAVRRAIVSFFVGIGLAILAYLTLP